MKNDRGNWCYSHSNSQASRYLTTINPWRQPDFCSSITKLPSVSSPPGVPQHWIHLQCECAGSTCIEICPLLNITNFLCWETWMSGHLTCFCNVCQWWNQNRHTGHGTIFNLIMSALHNPLPHNHHWELCPANRAVCKVPSAGCSCCLLSAVVLHVLVFRFFSQPIAFAHLAGIYLGLQDASDKFFPSYYIVLVTAKQVAC